MNEQKPSIGRIVHYVSHGTSGGEYLPANLAAIVTEVDSEDPTRVGLCVLYPSGMAFRSLADGGCVEHEGDFGADHNGDTITNVSYHGGSWHWPPRV